MAKKDKKVKKFNPNPGTSEFNGGLLGYIGINLLTSFIVLITATLGTAWAVCMYHRWVAKHTKINGKQVVFDGKGIQLFGKYIAWFFLGIITLTIYWWWLPIKMQKWLMKHTYLEETAVANAQYPTYPMAAQYPQQYAQQPAPYYGQYYYPCAPQAPVYPQNGCCRYYR